MNDIGWEHEKDMNESFFKREEKRKKSRSDEGMTVVICPKCNKPLQTIENQLARDGYSLLADCNACGKRYSISISCVAKEGAVE